MPDAASTPFPALNLYFSEAWWLAHYGSGVPAADRPRLLFDRFGDVGLGEENPAQPAPVVGGEYGDRFMAAFWGCEIVYQDGHAPAALVLPDARARMEDLEVPDLASSPVVCRALDDARSLRESHGSCAASVNLGGPLNNAVSVFGEEILFACAAEPVLADRVLRRMAEANLLILDHVVCPISGVDPAVAWGGGWGLGNCPVCMISPRTYRDVVLPVDLWLSRQFRGGLGLHHCGVFDAYAEVYKPLEPVGLDLGPGSDLALARAAYPGVGLSTYIEVGALSRMTRDDIDATLTRMIEDAGPPELFHAISVADAGPEISDQTVRDLLTAPTRLAGHVPVA